MALSTSSSGTPVTRTVRRSPLRWISRPAVSGPVGPEGAAAVPVGATGAAGAGAAVAGGWSAGFAGAFGAAAAGCRDAAFAPGAGCVPGGDAAAPVAAPAAAG